MIDRAPNVFVSSTLFDLSEVRAQIRQFIEQIGWSPVMSEHDSFPIDPDQSTVENCKRNVRENADIFVMAVGARYGSIDSETEKSVTNIEFLEARARGLPVYVFVEREVLAHMEVWRDNPEGDFTKVVDTPRVFEFIESFRNSGEVWTFEYSSAEELISKLRSQFAYLSQRALQLRLLTRDRDHLLGELAGAALTIALHREEYWELRLFATVLADELDDRSELRHEIGHDFSSGEVMHVDIHQLATWAHDRIDEFSRYAQTTETIVNAYLPQALRESEDPVAIAIVARRLARAWEDFARWTLRCRSVRVDERANRLVELLSNVSQDVLGEIWEFGHSIIPHLEEAVMRAECGDSAPYKLVLNLTADTEEFNDEIGRLQFRLFR